MVILALEQIKNELDILEFLVDHMDSETNVYTDENRELSSMADSLNMSQYLSVLQQEGYIKVFLGGTFVIYNKGIQVIADRKKQRSTGYFVLKISKKAVKWIFTAIGTIIVALITAFLVWKFGWN